MHEHFLYMHDVRLLERVPSVKVNGRQGFLGDESDPPTFLARPSPLRGVRRDCETADCLVGNEQVP